jgi:hypothetical protein
MDLARAAFLSSLPALMALVSSPLGGVISDRIGSRKKIVALPLVCMGVLCLTLFPASSAAVAAVMILMGVFLGPVPTATFSAVPEVMSSPEQIGIQLLIDNHVTAFIHGHDHQFAAEKRDGVVYQEVPMPSDAGYSNGFGRYLQSDPYTMQVLPNSGYLRFRVSPSDVTVDYVRVYPAGLPLTTGHVI